MWRASIRLWISGIPGVLPVLLSLCLQHLIGFEQMDICWMGYNFGLSTVWDFLHHCPLLSVCLILNLLITQYTVRSASLNYIASGIPVGRRHKATSLGLSILTDFCDFKGFPWGGGRNQIEWGWGKQGKENPQGRAEVKRRGVREVCLNLSQLPEKLPREGEGEGP